LVIYISKSELASHRVAATQRRRKSATKQDFSNSGQNTRLGELHKRYKVDNRKEIRPSEGWCDFGGGDPELLQGRSFEKKNFLFGRIFPKAPPEYASTVKNKCGIGFEPESRQPRARFFLDYQNTRKKIFEHFKQIINLIIVISRLVF
jgi:hypothetical protein